MCASRTDGVIVDQSVTEMLNQQVFCNDLILDCIFGFWKLEDILSFRQVCRQWNTVAIPFIKKLRLITFRKPDRSVERFHQFSQLSDLGTDYTRVKLTYHPNAYEDCEWELSELTEFLQAHKTKVTELTIGKIMLKGVRSGSHFDLDPHIAPSLTKLHIDGFGLMIISTDHCVSTKFLSLSGCRLKIASGIKINPVELTLSNVEIRRNGNPKARSLNEFVYFGRLKSLSLESLSHGDNNSALCKLSCHFRDPVTVERVDLCGDKLNLNFRNAKWKVTEKFSLRDANFVKPNQMEFSNFEIKSGSVQLAVLPRNLKKLKITEGPTEVLCSVPIRLPELEILNFLIRRYNYNAYQFRSLSFFKNCKYLKTLMLTIESSGDSSNLPTRVDIATFPKNVRKLYLSGNVEFYGCAPCFQLKQLYLKWNKPHSLNSILRTFKGEELTVDLRCHFYNSDSLHSIVKEISQRPFGSIAVALNHSHSLEGNNFAACPLSEITNEISGFYSFANGFGTAIPKSRFEQIFDFWEKIQH